MAHEVFSSDDYYGYRPLLRLERPVALFGIAGSKVGRTARAVNLLSGVPFVWVDRRVEHQVGKSVQRVDMEDGQETRRQLEREVLTRAMQERSHGFWALSSVTWRDEELYGWVAARCETICLEVTPDEACARIRRDVEEDARRHWTLRSDCGLSEARIRDELIRRRDGLPTADRTVTIAGRTPMEVAQDILEVMGLSTR